MTDSRPSRPSKTPSSDKVRASSCDDLYDDHRPDRRHAQRRGAELRLELRLGPSTRSTASTVDRRRARHRQVEQRDPARDRRTISTSSSDNVWDARRRPRRPATEPARLLAGVQRACKAQIYTRAASCASKITLLSGITGPGSPSTTTRSSRPPRTTPCATSRLAIDAGATMTSGGGQPDPQPVARPRPRVPRLDRWTCSASSRTPPRSDAIITFEVPAIFDRQRDPVADHHRARQDPRPDYLIEQATTARPVSWQQLANGARGLPQNQLADGRGGQRRRDQRPRAAGLRSPRERRAAHGREWAACPPG